MIYQFTTPVLFVAALFVAGAFLPVAARKILLSAGLGLVSALSAVASLAHNERQMLLTRNEKALRQAIASDVAKDPRSDGGPLHYLVFLDEGTRWFASDVLSPVYARTWFKGQPISYRLVPSPVYEPLQPAAPVVFLDDGQGVENAAPGGGRVGYAQVRVVMGSRGTFTIRRELAERDTLGFRVQWRRDGALRLGP